MDCLLDRSGQFTVKKTHEGRVSEKVNEIGASAYLPTGSNKEPLIRLLDPLGEKAKH